MAAATSTASRSRCQNAKTYQKTKRSLHMQASFLWNKKDAQPSAMRPLIILSCQQFFDCSVQTVQSQFEHREDFLDVLESFMSIYPLPL